MKYKWIYNIVVNKEDKLLNLLLVFIFSSAFFLRLFQLEQYPVEINHDELSNVYDGYCIAETGADRWGEKYPLILRGFGNSDYRPPMYAWLCAGSIKLFGYSTFAGRLPSAILGCISLLLVYSIALKLGGRKYGVLTLLIASLSPWHILFSRLAIEASVLPSFFIVLFFYLWIKARANYSNSYILVLLGISIGLATSAYQSTKLIFLIASFVVAYDLYKTKSFTLKNIVILGLSIFIGALPQLVVAFTSPEHFFSRANVTMVKPTFTLEYIGIIAVNFYKHLNPEYLFFSFGKENFLSIARLLPVELVFFYLGILIFNKMFKFNKYINPLYFYFFLFVTILPSAFTVNVPNSLRASTSILLFPFFSSAGILFLYNAIKVNLLKWTFLVLIILLILVNSVYNITVYANSFDLRNIGHQNVNVEICKRLNTYKGNYSTIYIEKGGVAFDLYVASYCNIKPKEYHSLPKEVIVKKWDEVIRLGKYNFLKKEEIELIIKQKGEKQLFVMYSKLDNMKLVNKYFINGWNVYFYERTVI